MSIKWIIIVCLSILITTLYFYNEEKLAKKYNIDNFNEIDSLFLDLKKQLDNTTKDSVYENRILNITNNYKTFYEKNDSVNNTNRYVLIDSLISRHKQIKLERSYTLFD